ncbi:MAG: MTAP family purine nucleoside phosphorylase [Methanospirillaceae archaeon]|nr:MTAP family purine nucleoside phosphorylase [Methanospirillaceae archaeon]
MLGIIGGTSILHSDISSYQSRTVDTPYGSSDLFYRDDVILLQRHQRNRPPHVINFRSHIAALAISGVDTIISIGSAGSLHLTIAPGSTVIPDDYLSTAAIPSFFNHRIFHIMPGINQRLKDTLSNLIPGAISNGRYIQVPGPRIETKAEIASYATSADIIGMTISSEATLANELEIPFASVCTVDNYANGITKEEISYDLIVSHAQKNQEQTDKIIQSIISFLS